MRALLAIALALTFAANADAALQARDWTGDNITDGYYSPDLDMTSTAGPVGYGHLSDWQWVRADIVGETGAGWYLPDGGIGITPVADCSIGAYLGFLPPVVQSCSRTTFNLVAQTFGITESWASDAVTVQVPELPDQWFSLTPIIGAGSDSTSEVLVFDPMLVWASFWPVVNGDVGQPLASPIPEPSTLSMLALGLALIIFVKRRPSLD